MARKFVDDGVDLFRVVVTQYVLVSNPNYDPKLGYSRDNPQLIFSDTKTETVFYGPYLSKGAAKVLRTQVTRDGYGESRKEVVGSHIEKADVVWNRIGD